MELFNNNSSPLFSGQTAEDFWQVSSRKVARKPSEPILIDIVTPQPKSQTQFFNRAKPQNAKAGSAKRVTRKRVTKGKKR